MLHCDNQVINKEAKDYTRDKFSDWFTRQINTGLENGQELDDIEVDWVFLKPLHAKWLTSFYNHMTTTKGQEVISNGWKKSGIYDAITLESNKPPPLNPFADLCPLIKAFQSSETLSLTSLFPQELDLYRWRAADETDDESSEWECGEVAEVDGNTLDLFSWVVFYFKLVNKSNFYWLKAYAMLLFPILDDFKKC